MNHPFLPIVALGEKVAMTYLQAFITLLVVSDAIGADKYQVAAIAAIPAGLTVLANGIPQVAAGLPFYVDLFFRTARTYAVSFIGLLLAMPVFHLNFTVAVAALTGAAPAALAVVKGELAKRFGNRESAAALPAHLDQAA